MRASFNRFLSADGFPLFFDSLYALYLTSITSKEEKCIFENIDSAVDYIRNLEYTGKIERYELNEALVLLIN